MRKHGMPEVKEGNVNVTPLIDIVMCLIIFFMLVTKIGVDTGADKSIVIPSSFLGTDIKDMGNTLTLNVINGPGDVTPVQPIITALVKGEKTELKIQDPITGAPQLLKTLQYIHDGDPERNLAPNPDFKVIIRGDQNLTYQFLAPVLIECTKARVKNVAFVTKESSDVDPGNGT